MTKDWTRFECEAIVDDYLEMLDVELRDGRYSKTEHRRALKRKLSNRTDGSIEYKHQNISAVLIRAGHVYVPGYKPAWNYQDLLAEVVNERIFEQNQNIIEVESALIARSPVKAQIEQTSDYIVEPPKRQDEKKIREKQECRPRHIDYAAREARNRSLGNFGEGFVIEFERKRLVEIGREDLVADVEWTSKKLGDGAGYDIRSFRGDTDEPLYIEVKTTNAGKYQPFLISASEVAFSVQHEVQFSLYRVFNFAKSPRLFFLEGSISAHVDLTPTVFSAQF